VVCAETTVERSLEINTKWRSGSSDWSRYGIGNQLALFLPSQCDLTMRPVDLQCHYDLKRQSLASRNARCPTEEVKQQLLART